MYGSRGCVGCCTKSTPIIAVDEPSKGLKIQGRRVNKPTPSEVFWSTSTYEMDNNGIQSQRSMSSLSTSNQTLDFNCGPSSTSATEFVNHGLLRWNQIRQEFLKNSKKEKQAPQVREPRLSPEKVKVHISFEGWVNITSWNATYDSLLGTNKPFPQPIPLSEMVDFLVDVWEAEGMYD